MLKDPIIEEIHRIQDEWGASFQYDLRALCEDIKRQEKRVCSAYAYLGHFFAKLR